MRYYYYFISKLLNHLISDIGPVYAGLFHLSLKVDLGTEEDFCLENCSEGFLANEKELSLCHKSQFSNTYIFKTRWSKPLIFQTLII